MLHEIELSVPAGSKVGVVGRTGAGKSSLLQVLFRMAEAESGCILIDNRDIQTPGLSAIRQRALSLLPQSPFIFEGTLRENLDPFSEFTEAELWEALHDVQLADKIMANAE